MPMIVQLFVLIVAHNRHIQNSFSFSAPQVRQNQILAGSRGRLAVHAAHCSAESSFIRVQNSHVQGETARPDGFLPALWRVDDERLGDSCCEFRVAPADFCVGSRAVIFDGFAVVEVDPEIISSESGS